MLRKKDIQELIITHNRRLQFLKQQKAIHGMDTSPAILIEIEDIEAKIAELQINLSNLNTSPQSTEITPSPPVENTIRNTLLCYLHYFLRIPLISYNSKVTGQRETIGIWLVLPVGILLAPFLGSVLWLAICRLYGWPYYLGGSSNEPQGFHAFLWGAITNGPVIVFALFVALPYTLPKLSVLRTWQILILSYVVCSGLGGILFYDFDFRPAIEAYQWPYASQETFIIAVWSSIIAISTGVPLLLVYRVAHGLIHLPSIIFPIILPVIFSVVGLFVFLVLLPHLPISDWIRGIFAGLFLRFGMFIGLIVVFMFNPCKEYCQSRS